MDWLSQWLSQLFSLGTLVSAITLAVKSVLVFLQRDSYLYWPYLLSTLVIAMLAWRYGHARHAGDQPGWRAFSKRHLGMKLWWHASARADYRFYLVNAVLFPLLAGPVLFGTDHVIHWINGWLGMAAAPSSGHTPGFAALMIYTLLFFVVYDFGRFVAHSLLHDVPALWQFHKVHHSAEVLTPMTSFRAHPLDLAIMAWMPALTTGLLTWWFQRYVNSGVTVYTYLGVHVLFFIGNLIGNLRHWQVWLSYGQTLNRWLISPAHHQLHHSAEPRHWGCNRGFEIAVWDRLYGTLHVPSDEPEAFKMGLGDETDGHWHGVWRMYAWPFLMLFGWKPRTEKPAPPP
jgi:sterol desaturase/sphingolipid hydroxylase (fatty acid hydroxylase superfamily)